LFRGEQVVSFCKIKRNGSGLGANDFDRNPGVWSAIVFLPFAGGWGDRSGDRFPGLAKVSLMIFLEPAGIIFLRV
jgi:hypothetical protein